MAQFKFDWTAKISGIIEIGAENGLKASELINFCPNAELIERSRIPSDNQSSQFSFVTANQVEAYTEEESDDFWKEHS